MRTRVKICGITNIRDALWAAQCGADAIGFVFYPKSPRAVDIEQVEKVCQQLPAFVSKVALFVDADEVYVKDVIRGCSVDLLQFHGNESINYCDQFKLPYIKAVRVRDRYSVNDAFSQYTTASAFLLDAYKPGVPGGTGEVFNWDWIPRARPEKKPIILAGGLTPANVVSAIKQTQPFAVDVSGGVEESKGKKDPIKVADFIQGVNSVQQ